MSKSQHTPGPWKALEGKNGWQIHTDNKPGKGSPNTNHWIANIKCESCPAHEEANALLIAAAPDLLEALDIVVGCLLWDKDDKTSIEVMRRVNAARDKAEGRS